jgi:cell division protein FtsI (penicillin-binding protein 3)
MKLEGIKRKRYIKLISLFSIIFLLIVIFLKSVFDTIKSERKIPSHTSTHYNRALRGSIISKDGFTLSRSEKIYSASIYYKSIKPEKMSLFVKLFSIYSKIDEKTVTKKIIEGGRRQQKMKNRIVRVTLSRNIDAETAVFLKTLSRKLMKLGVFRRVANSRGEDVLYGLDIRENGEKRIFPLKDTLSPALGYTRTLESEHYFRNIGVKGLERRYEKYLTNMKDGYIKGMRDVAGTIVRNRSSIRVFRRDGYSLHLNISLDLQRYTEKIVDRMKSITDASEIVAAVMESSTGKIVALCSSERYDPSNIGKDEIYKLIPKVSEYAYAPGSVMKPITLSIAMELGRVKAKSWFDTENGRMAISRRFRITDDEPFDSLTAEDIIVHSSNIGITKIGWRLSGREIHSGLMRFGFSKASGIDLSRESRGMIRSAKLLENRVNRATQSYGYGMKATFIQLLRAYGAFNNDGIILKPSLVDYLESADGKRYRLNGRDSKSRAISAKTAHSIKKILKKVVNEGTGKAAIFHGLEIGGKTGTAHIAENNGYSKRYNSSFFGFANDKRGRHYTIGVLVIEPKDFQYHFASRSAVPTFRKIVESMVTLGYLEPEMTKRERSIMKEQKKIRQKTIQKIRRERKRKIKKELKRHREEIRKQRRKKAEPNTKSYHKNNIGTPQRSTKSSPLPPKSEKRVKLPSTPTSMPDLF